MRSGIAVLAGAVIAFPGTIAYAQRSGVQVSGAAQVVSGDSQRRAGQEPFQPDFGVSWLRPGSRFGQFQMEIRATERRDRLHPGRIYGALRDARAGGLRWTLEAGDAYFTPDIGQYRFSNLHTPAVTYVGGAVSARSDRTAVSVGSGRATAWRNIFGSDPDTLDQSLALGRVTHQFSPSVDASVRASRVRTGSLGEYAYSIEASDQIGGGLRYAVTSDVQLIADATLVSYRRRGAPQRERDGSGLVGVHWLHGRGWVQLDGYRFSPGEMPTLHSSLPDREGVFGAGEYDLLSRVRVFAGSEVFRASLYAGVPVGPAALPPRTSGLRSFGGVRVQVGSRSTVTLRLEDGDRVSRPILGGIDSDSDTGSWAAEWQTSAGRFTGHTRYARRENVDRVRTEGSYSQEDASAQVFLGLGRSAQLFGLASLTKMDQPESKHTYWQAGGGGQLQVFSRNLWMRAEGTVSRNIDLLLGAEIPRESLNVGVNGQLTRLTTVGVNVYVDRVSAPAVGSPWGTRSVLRVTRLFPADTPVPGRSPLSTTLVSRGTGSVRGVVFVDWNANGSLEPDEPALEGIPLVAKDLGTAATRRSGEFVFLGVPTGLREVGLDLRSLPVDYDPPTIDKVLVDVTQGRTTEVRFGLIPLGTVRGRVVRDANGNLAADAGDDPIDGAVVVLDGGQRSERVANGRFAFEAVRSGRHTVQLLVDSLPDGSVVSGTTEQALTLDRGSLEADLVFLISRERRPEIRRVFPGGRAASASPTRAPAPARAAPPAATLSRTSPSGNPGSARPTPETARGRFSVQVAALNDPLRARAMVEELREHGYDSFLVVPPSSDPDAPFRIRVGRYRSRADAGEILRALERDRGEKLWIVQDVSAR
ncbi:MAG TPA: SPOR domain-containing protein [Vicinamibacterales bacterium]|nr:SPOR domain-containing protein [Vicinamibacterales bacterium]